MFHIFGFQVTLNLALLQGATVVVLPRFELDSFLTAVQNYAVTRAEVVPPIVLALAASDRVDDFDLSSLRVVTAAAAPLDADLARACAARIGCRIKLTDLFRPVPRTVMTPCCGPVIPLPPPQQGPGSATMSSSRQGKRSGTRCPGPCSRRHILAPSRGRAA